MENNKTTKIIAVLEVDNATLESTGSDFETEMAWVASSGIEMEEFAVIPQKTVSLEALEMVAQLTIREKQLIWRAICQSGELERDRLSNLAKKAQQHNDRAVKNMTENGQTRIEEIEALKKKLSALI